MDGNRMLPRRGPGPWRFGSIGPSKTSSGRGRPLRGMAVLCIFLAATSCRREGKESRVPTPPSPPARTVGAVEAGAEIPHQFVHLRFQLVSNASPPVYRVRSDQDPSADFLVPASVLRSLIADERVPQETRAAAVLAYPQLEKVVREKPPASHADEGADELLREWVLVSLSQGEVRVRPDAQRRGFVRVESRDRTVGLPAGPALSVLRDAHLSDEQKIQALFTFPALEPLSPEAE